MRFVATFTRCRIPNAMNHQSPHLDPVPSRNHHYLCQKPCKTYVLRHNCHMAFTATDLETVECAIQNLIAGKQVVQVDIGGRTEVYTPVRLKELTDFRDIIKADLNVVPTAQRMRIFRSTFSKGL